MPFDAKGDDARNTDGRGKLDVKIVAGNSNRPLAEAICAHVKLPITKGQVKRFADMEVFVEIQENVRGTDVFILQSTSFPTNILRKCRNISEMTGLMCGGVAVAT